MLHRKRSAQSTASIPLTKGPLTSVQGGPPSSLPARDAVSSRRRRRLSLGLAPRIVGLVAVAALFSGAVVGWLSVSSSRSALQDQVLTDYQSQADLAAEFSRRYVQATQQTLDWLARQPNIATAARNENYAALATLLPVILSIQPRLQNVSLVDRTGEVRASAVSAGVPANLSEEEWFRTARATRQPYVSLPVAGRTSGKPVVNYAVPVLEESGDVAAMFVGSLSLETLSNGLIESLSTSRSRVTLVDRRANGTVIADEDVARILEPAGETDAVMATIGRQERSATSSRSADGEERLVAVAPVPDLPWSVVVQEDSASALAPVGDLTRRMLVVSGLVILAACAVSSVLAMQFTRPLARLRTAVHGFAAGDLRRRLSFTQRDEIGEVGRAFDVMAGAVEARTADVERVVSDLRAEIYAREETEAALERARVELEMRVDERTAELAAAYQALRQREEDFRLLVDGARDYALIMLDPEGRVVTWNDGARRLYGYEANEILGREFTVFSTGLGPEAARQVLDETLAKGSIIVEGSRVRKDGSRFWGSVVVTALHDSEGELRGFSRLTRDITEQREANERLVHSEERFRTFVEQSVDGIIIADVSGLITHANAAAAVMFGAAGDDITGRRVEEFLPQEQRAAHVSHRATFLQDPRPRSMGVGLTLSGLRQDGSQFPVNVSLTPLHTPGGLQVAATITDITERVRAEEELANHAAELQRSNAELEQFAYVASHDLQEPLRMVSNYTQLLARRYQGKLDEDADVFIGYAVEGAGRMQQLINDLLHYSRVGTHGSDLEPTEMDTALDRALRNLQTMVDDAGAVIDREPLPAVRGDEVQLAQVFQNLIANAIKFRGAEPPRIRIGVRRDETNWLFSVSDNGIGIDPAYFERIFVIFQRLHGREEYPGTGIGLALCKRIVERHHGSIWVESAPGEGTTFSFTMPAATGHLTQEATSQAAAAA